MCTCVFLFLFFPASKLKHMCNLHVHICSQWDLVCDNQWKVPFASSTLFVGYLVGSLISGQLSDRYHLHELFVFVFMVQVSCAIINQEILGEVQVFGEKNADKLDLCTVVTVTVELDLMNCHECTNSSIYWWSSLPLR